MTQDINIEKFKEKKVLVIGEGMLDIYIHGSTSRLCREAPVPIVSAQSETYAAGGAANTAANIATLGASVSFLTVVGKDTYAEILKKTLTNFGVNISNVLSSVERKTIVKKRILANSQLVARLDTGTLFPIAKKFENKIIEVIKKSIQLYDAIVISDYDYGIISSKIIQEIKFLLTKNKKNIFVDAKNLKKYQFFPVTAIKPNYEEICNFLHIKKCVNQNSKVDQIIGEKNKIFSLLHAETIAITLDKEGALLLDRNGDFYRTYSKPVANVKAVGAGDTYVAALTLALTCKSSLVDAGDLATDAASIVIEQDGTNYCTNSDLQSLIYTRNKYITEHKSLINLINNLKQKNKKIIFTNGCFDILHPGHISYLQAAKKIGDVLIVAINSDASIQQIKGHGRPVNTLMDRLKILSALSCVDYIVSFDEKTPKNLIKIISPHYFVKGGDYNNKNLPEKKLVKKLGGKIVFIPFIKNYSTTNLIHRITTISHNISSI